MQQSIPLPFFIVSYSQFKNSIPYWKLSVGPPLCYLFLHICYDRWWIISVILFYFFLWIKFWIRIKELKVPRPQVEFTGNKNICNNFQIVFTDTILFYRLEAVLSKGNHTEDIGENEKLKQSIDGSFLTAKNEEAVPSQGKRGRTWCLKQWELWWSQLQRIP